MRLDPQHVGALQKLAELKLAAGETAAARAHLETFVRVAPESAEGRWARGKLERP